MLLARRCYGTTILAFPRAELGYRYDFEKARLLFRFSHRKRSTMDEATRKRPRVAVKSDDDLCSFCQQRPAVLLVKIPSLRKKKPLEQSLCLLHYYTTSAVRVNINGDNKKSDDVRVLNQEQLDRQLPEMQEIFADVFVELQQELSEEAARSFDAKDPLGAVLGGLNKNSGKRSLKHPPKPPPKLKNGDANAGGFIPKVALPDRLIRTQQEQARIQLALTKRMKRAEAGDDQPNVSISVPGFFDHPQKSLTKRRTSSRKSIWNQVMETGLSTKQSTEPASNVIDLTRGQVEGISCSCGSRRVQCLSSNTNRNQDSHKGETWGNKDRADEVMTRYQCLTCGKTWSEEE